MENISFKYIEGNNLLDGLLILKIKWITVVVLIVINNNLLIIWGLCLPLHSGLTPDGLKDHMANHGYHVVPTMTKLPMSKKRAQLPVLTLQLKISEISNLQK